MTRTFYFKVTFGFRKNHSASYALIHLYDKISSAIDRSENTEGNFLDLWKAFDILFDKLDYYGFRGVVIDWIKDYFFERAQFVDYNPGH